MHRLSRATTGWSCAPSGSPIHTIADDRDNLTRGLIRLGNYLGLVALAALLLGGLGVASAVHVFIRQQLDSIAVLRCLGATSWQVFGVLLLQTLVMGLLGSLLGALLGVGLQQLMPSVVHDFLPVGVRVLPSPHAILIGIGSGLWTAIIFALLPLLGVRAVPPLATLRRAVEPSRAPWDRLRIAAALDAAGEHDCAGNHAGRLAPARCCIHHRMCPRALRALADVAGPHCDHEAVGTEVLAVSCPAGTCQPASTRPTRP